VPAGKEAGMIPNPGKTFTKKRRRRMRNSLTALSTGTALSFTSPAWCPTYQNLVRPFV
jgi:hypothetical protein